MPFLLTMPQMTPLESLPEGIESRSWVCFIAWIALVVFTYVLLLRCG